LALALLERTRDLRIMTHLAVARLHLAGPPGYAEVLKQIRHQIETRWEQVHPQLDPEDNNDPTLRANALFRLQDPVNVLVPLRDQPLATAALTGPVSWRDIAIFRGQIEPEQGREKRTEAFIRGAFNKTDPERLQALRDGIDLAAAEAAAIPAAFEAKAGPGTAPDFTNLAKLLADIQKELRQFEPVVAAEPAGDGADASGTTGSDGSDQRQAAPRGGFDLGSLTAVTTRDDALQLLELASAYFRSYEPSSPVPLLIDRARRLATMDFMEILQDLAPEGVVQAKIVTGGAPE
jgi:type VI secretion system protein ImpA